MTDVYLRVEAVNLNYSVYDTNDISTVRGGSFMLLDAVTRLKIDFSKELEAVSCGARAGIFRFRSDVPNVREAKENIRNKLSEYTGNHAAFAVDTVESNGESFMEIQHKLITLNRLGQMRSLNIPLGSGFHSGDTFCDKDGIRPVIRKEGVNEHLSESVKFRQGKGRDLRNGIYEAILKETSGDFKADYDFFTNDFEELSKNSTPGLNGLDGKIAFIYADGNKFGAIRSTHCHDEDTLKKFDIYVQDEFRKPLLDDVITEMKNDSASLTENYKIRLETLLWGGDEIEWVVPAWKGWALLRQLYNRNILEFSIFLD